jgi:hypothetical protein
MLGLLLDGAVIMLLIYLVNQGQEMDLGPAVISALVIGIGSWIAVLALSPSIGIFSLLPIFGLAILVIWMVSGLPLGRAAIAGTVFGIYKIVLSLVFAATMS